LKIKILHFLSSITIERFRVLTIYQSIWTVLPLHLLQKYEKKYQQGKAMLTERIPRYNPGTPAGHTEVKWGRGGSGHTRVEKGFLFSCGNPHFATMDKYIPVNKTMRRQIQPGVSNATVIVM
jgi:hypothetical protein